MRYPQHATLDVTRTRLGYQAVLRIQGPDGTGVGLVGRCSDREARAILMRQHGAEVGFSFRHMARRIKHVASKVARSRVFKGLMKVAKLMPPPVSTTAVAAEGAAKVLGGMLRGDHAARRVWTEAAGRARLQPQGTTAVGMRLAMQAMGRPRFVRGGSGGTRTAQRQRTRAASSAVADEITASVLEALRQGARASAAEPAAEPPAAAGAEPDDAPSSAELATE